MKLFTWLNKLIIPAWLISQIDYQAYEYKAKKNQQNINKSSKKNLQQNNADRLTLIINCLYIIVSIYVILHYFFLDNQNHIQKFKDQNKLQYKKSYQSFKPVNIIQGISTQYDINEQKKFDQHFQSLSQIAKQKITQINNKNIFNQHLERINMIKQIMTVQIINQRTQQNSQQIQQKEFFKKSFSQKIEQIRINSNSKFIQLKLYPIIMAGYTTPKKKQYVSQSFFNAINSVIKGKNVGYDPLFQMLNKGGYWHSIGNKLTVTSISQNDSKNDLQIQNSQLMIPSVFEISFPYNIPQNEAIKIWGIRIQYTALAANAPPPIRLLGQFNINITPQERQNKEPVKRIFYCQQYDCALYYGYIKFQMKYQFRVHELKIYSDSTLTKY